jgi:WD40 repeat protein
MEVLFSLQLPINSVVITNNIRRLTAHPEYVDPVDISADDKWTVALDTRVSDRNMFLWRVIDTHMSSAGSSDELCTRLLAPV